MKCLSRMIKVVLLKKINNLKIFISTKSDMGEVFDKEEQLEFESEQLITA